MALVKLKLNGLPGPIATVVPGTPVPISLTPLLVSGFSIQVAAANTDVIQIKDSSGNLCMVLSQNSPSANFAADESEADEDKIVWDLSDIFIDSPTAAQEVLISYYTLESVNY